MVFKGDLTMKQTIWPLFFSLLLTTLVDAEPVALSDFIQQVSQSNPTVGASKFAAQAQQKRILPSFALDDPFFAVGVDEVPFSDPSMGIVRYQLSLGVPFPSKLMARRNIAEHRAAEFKANSEMKARELVVVATQAYYRAAFNAQEIELNRDIYSLVANLVSSAQSRYQAGEGTHHEWLQAKIETALLTVALAKLRREQKIIRAWMNELRNQPPNSDLEILPVNFTATPALANDTPDSVLEQQPELKSLTASWKIRQSEMSLATAAFFPDLVLQGMAMQPFGQMDEPMKWGAMLGISVPLFFWQKQGPQYTAASLELKAANYQKQALENSLRTEIAAAQLELTTAREVLKLYIDEVLPLTEIGVENAKSAYVSRRSPVTQLIDSLKTQRAQKTELYAARIDVELAKLRLREVLSRPPLLRFSPSRPSTLDRGGMPTMTPSAATTGMGRGSVPQMGSSAAISNDTGDRSNSMGEM